MILIRSFAKVNLALAVLGRRADGFHEIRTVFQSIDLHDELEIRPCEAHGTALPGSCLRPDGGKHGLAGGYGSGSCSFACLGCRNHPEETHTRGCGFGWRAAATRRPRFWDSAGSGGSESLLLNLHRNCGRDRLRCSFFLQGGTALGIGRGEEIYPLPEIPSDASRGCIPRNAHLHRRGLSFLEFGVDFPAGTS